MAEQTPGDLARLVTFSDAVVAIAATLLVLPLAENATRGDSPTLGDIIAESGGQILLVLLGFFVICRFWLNHHDIMRNLVTFDPPLFWVNAVWMVSIVLLPFTTSLIGTSNSSDPATTGLYIGNMLVTCLAALAMQWHVTRTPSLQTSESRGTARLTGGVVAAIALAVALGLAILVPSIGPWALLLLAVDGFVTKALRRRTEKPGSPRRRSR
ncbi:TMEM175 family protein [Agreia sp. Leaf210]|uniref:TMEM175 family protein n=1 Tax=Agreia sp. Leaf210 TaxID=1735682 RepID=UPI0022869816|nr:TMEM175 family protein [Agreia sp. Leaf210]